MNRMTSWLACASIVIATATCSDSADRITDPPSYTGPTGVVAFVSDRDGNPEIYTSNADGTNIRRLTTDPSEDYDPVWSPDGTRIAFVSKREDGETSSIYVMNADGTNVVRRTIIGDSRDPAWSPDGRRIAFSARRSPGANQLVYAMNVDEDWHEPVLVGFSNDLMEMRPAWSPDGSKIAFTSAGDYTAGLFIANADGSGIVPLLKNATPGVYTLLSNAAWSPDGSKIAVVRCLPFPCLQTKDVVTMNADGSGAVVLKTVRGEPRLTWSPDARFVAMADDCAAFGPTCKPSIQYFTPDGAQAGTLIANAYSPAWRPDPRAVNNSTVNAPPGVTVSDPVSGTGKAFVSSPGQTFPNASLVTLENRTRNGTPVPALVINGGFDPVGVFANKGDELELKVAKLNGEQTTGMVVKVPPRKPPGIVRTSPSKGRIDVALTVQIEVIFTEPVDKSTINASSFHLLENGVPVNGKVTLSDDGLTATFIPDSPLHRLTSYTIEVTRGVRDLDGDSIEDAESATFTTASPPNGTLAFVSDRDGNAEIYTSNADGTDLKRLTNDPGSDIDPAWSPDGKRIAFISDRDGSRDLYVMNADGSNLVRKSTLKTWIYGVAWSPDGKRVAYGYAGFDATGIRVVDADSDWTNGVTYSPGEFAYTLYPSWSPDGKRITFASDWGLFDGQQVFTMKSDGTDLQLVAHATATYRAYDEGSQYYQPAWSPDGKSIAVVECHWAPHTCYPYSTVSIVNTDGTNLHSLVFAGGDARPAWSPDSKLIAFTSSSCWVCTRLIRYARADGTTAGITNDVLIENGYSPAWKP